MLWLGSGLKGLHSESLDPRVTVRVADYFKEWEGGVSLVG